MPQHRTIQLYTVARNKVTSYMLCMKISYILVGGTKLGSQNPQRIPTQIAKFC